MKQALILIILFGLTISSCGKKGALTYEGERKQAVFDEVIDEE
jgi:predicted small lipoprotein YifL